MAEFDVDVLAEKIADRLAERLDQRPLLTINEAALRLAVSRRQLYDLIGDGKLQTLKIGERQKIEQTEVDRYIRERRRPEGGSP